MTMMRMLTIWMSLSVTGGVTSVSGVRSLRCHRNLRCHKCFRCRKCEVVAAVAGMAYCMAYCRAGIAYCRAGMALALALALALQAWHLAGQACHIAGQAWQLNRAGMAYCRAGQACPLDGCLSRAGCPDAREPLVTPKSRFQLGKGPKKRPRRRAHSHSQEGFKRKRFTTEP